MSRGQRETTSEIVRRLDQWAFGPEGNNGANGKITKIAEIQDRHTALLWVGIGFGLASTGGSAAVVIMKIMGI
jgi:hypothetical protein